MNRFVALGSPPKMRRLVELKRALFGSLVAQTVLLLAASLITDGGVVAFWCMVAIAVHWGLVGYLALRRPQALTPGDQTLMKLGFLIFGVLLPAAHVGLGAVPWLGFRL